MEFCLLDVLRRKGMLYVRTISKMRQATNNLLKKDNKQSFRKSHTRYNKFVSKYNLQLMLTVVFPTYCQAIIIHQIATGFFPVFSTTTKSTFSNFCRGACLSCSCYVFFLHSLVLNNVFDHQITFLIISDLSDLLFI